MEHILDEYSNQPLSKELYETIKWWEQRRIFYNIPVGLAGLIPFFVFPPSSIRDINFLIFFMGIFVYAFFANLCYCFGWTIDILKSFYFENPTYGKSKSILFALGLIFSILFTLMFSWISLPIFM